MLIIAALATNSGKTTVCAALIRALSNRSFAIAPLKIGPDYIDPSFHSLAAGGAICDSWDGWGQRAETQQEVLDSAAARGAIVAEGVMGLFDGEKRGSRAGDAAGSTASMAKACAYTHGSRVILLVDASGGSTTLAVMIKGLIEHDPGVPIAGVIFNKVGSLRHAAHLRDEMAAIVPSLPVLGAIPRAEAWQVPRRHLGLVLAEETGWEQQLDILAGELEAHVDVDTIASWIAGRESVAPRKQAVRSHEKLRIAVAYDAAFRFVYPYRLRAWRQAGHRVELFSPLADESPHALRPDFVYLPGGYPELHAEQLSGALNFRDGMRNLAAGGAGAPIIFGECGGYMAMLESLIARDGTAYPMLGLLPGRAQMGSSPQLGYRQVRLASGIAGERIAQLFAGERLRAHEFHYARFLPADSEGALYGQVTDAAGTGLAHADWGQQRGRIAGGFAHLIDGCT